MEPHTTGRSGPSQRPDDRKGSRESRELEVWRGAPPAPAAAGGAGQPQPSATLPRQPLPHLPPENAIAGMDIFSQDPSRRPDPGRATPGRPRESGYVPSAPQGEARGGPLPPASTAVALAPREPTLSQQLRSVAPPDVARQAISELGVLARELEALPERLEQSGLTHLHERGYRQAAVAYVGLAERAWEAVAEERLEQSGAEADYRAQAIDIARQITHMQHESRMVTENASFRLSRRRPLFWRRRVRLVHTGLASWMATVSTPANPLAMGQGLFQLRGYVGLANASFFELALLGALVAGVNVASFLLGWGLVLLQIPTILAGDTSTAVALAFGALLVAIVWMLSLLLTVVGPAPLRLQLGATLYTPMRTVRNAQPGSVVLSGLLRTWGLLMLLGGVASALAALAESGLWVSSHLPTTSPADFVQASQLAGRMLVVFAAPAGGICLAALLLLALPQLLVSQSRLSAELAGNPSWVPAARRFALRPTIGVLGFLTGGLLIAVYAAATAVGFADPRHTVLILVTPFFQGIVTWRAALLLLVAVLPYLLLVELPYRLGLHRWQERWLENLTGRRAELESHMRRLSAADPRSGAQNASDENLRAMQYDLVLLQFYRSKIEETERTPTAPLSWRRALALFALGILLAVLVDNIGAVITLLVNSSSAFTHLLGG